MNLVGIGNGGCEIVVKVYIPDHSHKYIAITEVCVGGCGCGWMSVCVCVCVCVGGWVGGCVGVHPSMYKYVHERAQ